MNHCPLRRSSKKDLVIQIKFHREIVYYVSGMPAEKINIERLGKVTKEILQYVAVGSLCCVALSSPGGASKLAKVLWSETKKSVSGYKNDRIKQLSNGRYISTQGGKIILTKRGRSLLARAELDGLEVERHRWDHIWRCVAYDIPNELSLSRRAFHRKLMGLGFAQIQKSVLVCPYRCEEQVAIIARFYEIEGYILFMEANDLPSASRLKSKFNLENNELISIRK